MATTTPKLSLRKPATTDNVSVQTDLNDNYDKLDTPDYVGAAGDVMISSKVTGDAQQRLQILGDGTIKKGAGAAAPRTKYIEAEFWEHPAFKYVSGRYYRSPYILDGSVGSSPSANFVLAQPLIIFKGQLAIDRVGVNVGNQKAGATARIGIYNVDADYLPTTLLHGTGTLDCSSIGYKEATVALTLEPGIYWLAVKVEGADLNTPSFNCVTSMLNGYVGAVQGSVACGNQGAYDLISSDAGAASGAMPSPFPAYTRGPWTDVPVVAFRVT